MTGAQRERGKTPRQIGSAGRGLSQWGSPVIPLAWPQRPHPHRDNQALRCPERSIYAAKISMARNIAETLDTLDAVIRGTEAGVGKVKAAQPGVRHDLLTRAITARGDLCPPQTGAPRLCHHTPLGWLPQEREVKRSAHIAGEAVQRLHRTLRAQGDRCSSCQLACAKATASAPAGKRRRPERSCAACQTASATSLSFVVRAGLAKPAKIGWANSA